MQKVFFKEFSKLLDDLNEKDRLIDYIYKIRYLKYLPVSKNKFMKNIIDFSDLEQNTIKKCIEKNIITPISNNAKTDYLLLKSLFETRNIAIEVLQVKLNVQDGKLISEIYDGDILIVERCSTARNGETVVAMNKENEATVKTFYKENGYFRLQPENDTMEPIILDEVTILGKVVGLYRKF